MTITTEDKQLEKIRKLLAKAEGTDNETEAETFNAAAQRLIVQWSIDESVLASKGESADTIGTITINIPRSQYQTSNQILLNASVDANGCRGVISRVRGQNLQRVTIVGFQKDLHRVEILYTSLLVQRERSFGSPENQRRLRFNNVVRGDAVKWRNSFYITFGRTVSLRLAEIREQTVTAEESKSPGVGLVLFDRKLEIDDHFRDLFPRTSKGTKKTYTPHKDGEAAGASAGARADLGRESVGQRTAGALTGGRNG